jgi:hypothetical protein
VPKPVPVLYVMGMSRSGTTLLGELLGQAPGLFYAGEVRWLWRQALSDGRCGCGESLGECSIWARVLDQVGGEAAERDVRLSHLASLGLAAVGERHTWTRIPRIMRRPSDVQGEYARALARAFRAMLDVTGAELVVDTSSEVSDAALLSCHPDVDVRIVHLVRDPRGVVNSHRRAVKASGRRFSAASAAYVGTSWIAFNGAAEILLRNVDPTHHRRERYEDLVNDPARSLDRVLALFGRSLPSGLVADGRVHLAATHSAAGNPRRFDTGDVVLREDRGWESELPALDRRLIRAISAPLARGYAYR